jgi:hypothetical protein
VRPATAKTTDPTGVLSYDGAMNRFTKVPMPIPTGRELKAARMTAGLSQVEAAELMGYPVQAGSRGGLQSRTWQALESESDQRNMPGPIFAMFLLLTQQHADYCLTGRDTRLPDGAIQNLC